MGSTTLGCPVPLMKVHQIWLASVWTNLPFSKQTAIRLKMMENLQSLTAHLDDQQWGERAWQGHASHGSLKCLGFRASGTAGGFHILSFTDASLVWSFFAQLQFCFIKLSTRQLSHKHIALTISERNDRRKNLYNTSKSRLQTDLITSTVFYILVPLLFISVTNWIVRDIRVGDWILLWFACWRSCQLAVETDDQALQTVKPQKLYVIVFGDCRRSESCCSGC